MAGRPGRKPKKSLEEQIDQISKDIETYRESIKTLEVKRNELLKEKREYDLSELYKFITDNNLSVSDVQQIIEEYQNDKDETEQPELNVI